jgi:hypothetical protein
MACRGPSTDTSRSTVVNTGSAPPPIRDLADLEDHLGIVAGADIRPGGHGHDLREAAAAR